MAEPFEIGPLSDAACEAWVDDELSKHLKITIESGLAASAAWAEARRRCADLVEPSVRERIKIGDYVNHHGYLGIVTWTGESGFTFETLYNGKPNGESFVFDYDSMSEKKPKTCWVTEQ